VGTKDLKKTQTENENLANYKNKKAIYIPKSITKKFIKKFYKNLMQKHNGVTALVQKLKKEYIV